MWPYATRIRRAGGVLLSASQHYPQKAERNETHDGSYHDAERVGKFRIGAFAEDRFIVADQEDKDEKRRCENAVEHCRVVEHCH